jgi:hypothetical protein
MMEKHCSDIVQMSIQCEKTPPCLVTPDLDLIVVTSGHEEGLSRVEVNASDRTVVLFESVNESSHAVIP